MTFKKMLNHMTADSVRKYEQQARAKNVSEAFKNLATIVANDFVWDLQILHIASFNELIKLNRWTSKDIRNYVQKVIDEVSDGEFHIDDDGIMHSCIDNETISYRKFSAMFRKIISDRIAKGVE